MTDRQEPGTSSEKLTQLFQNYLSRQVRAHSVGLGMADGPGVVPHDAVPLQPVEPHQAWEDALAVATYLVPRGTRPTWEVCCDWPALVAAQEPASALPFCLGSFPQQIRFLQPLLRGESLATLPPTNQRPLPFPGLAKWASQQEAVPARLLAAGLLRLARHLDLAASILDSCWPIPPQWKALLDNERAALTWQTGQVEAALASWEAQPESVPVLFNRGLALLLLKRPAPARSVLSEAIHELPETSSWHHLGQLYLNLASR